MTNVRVVLDANVWISGLLWTGTPNRLIQAAEAGHLTLLASPAIVEEICDALARPKFAARITALNSSMAELMESLLSVVEVTHDPRIEPVISQDPDDDKILACAVASEADWIISGDHHLLSLKRYSGIPIVTPKQFWHAWAKRRK